MEKDVLLVDKTLYQETAHVLGQAFKDDPLVCVTLEGIAPDKRVERLTTTFAAAINAYSRTGYYLYVQESEKVAGVAIIHPPNTYPLPISAQLKLLMKLVLKHGLYGRLDRWIKWTNAAQKIHPKTPHYFLELIGVKPTLQGKGFGSVMINRLVLKADREKMGCYLESTNPQNISLYKRFGFQTISEEDIIGVHAWFMWRDPAYQVTGVPEK